MKNKNPRIIILLVLFVVIGAGIFSRIVHIQVALDELGREIGNRSSIKYKSFEPIRGNIYDRWGNLLAGNNEVYEIGVDLVYVNDNNRDELINFLTNITGVKRDLVEERLSIEYDPEKAVFATIYKNAPKEMVDEIAIAQKENDDLFAISWSGRLNRRYPEGRLGVNILGFFGNEGYYGVEGFYENILSTTSEQSVILMDPFTVMDVPDIPQGDSIMLTIDREIQGRMEKIVDQAVQNHGAESGTIIVMDPETGEILAMATTPRADPNLSTDAILAEYPIKKVDDVDVPTPFNRAVMQNYEPGSVFKVITMAAALDAGVVTPDTEFIDTGIFQEHGATIYNWDYGAWGPQTMTTCMQHSLNVCLSWVADQLEFEQFYNYLHAFHIDRKTNIDLASEASYPLLSPQNPTPFGSNPDSPRWVPSMMYFQSFGQGVSVTPIRMITSVSALANDGRMMAPHIQKAIVQDGRIRYYSPKIVATPIKPETAQTITAMLEASLKEESSGALVEGYSVAGKTGTAEIPTKYGYTSGLTNASFVGWGPTDDPKFIVYIWLEKPTSSIWSSVVAAPVFREVVENLVILMDIPPDHIRMEMATH